MARHRSRHLRHFGTHLKPDTADDSALPSPVDPTPASSQSTPTLQQIDMAQPTIHMHLKSPPGTSKLKSSTQLSPRTAAASERPNSDDLIVVEDLDGSFNPGVFDPDLARLTSPNRLSTDDLPYPLQLSNPQPRWFASRSRRVLIHRHQLAPLASLPLHPIYIYNPNDPLTPA